MIIADINKLREPCQFANIFEAQGIINQLEEYLRQDQSGVGLASPQIGIQKKVCIIRHKDMKINFVNPKILQQYDLMEFHEEGCLSFPNSYVSTKRYNEIVVSDLINGKIILIGFEAVIAQHEIGHLNGEVMFDYEIKIPKLNALCWCGNKKKYKDCHNKKVIKI